MLRLWVAALLVAGCWRGTTPASFEPEPFVARIHALAELRAATDALPPRLDIVEQRIIGLISEADRDAVRSDLTELAQDVVALRGYVTSLRAQGADPHALDAISHKLTRVSETVAQLNAELVYAHTLAEHHALDQQASDTADPADLTQPIRRVLVRRPVTAEPAAPDDNLVLPPFTRRVPVRRELP